MSQNREVTSIHSLPDDVLAQVFIECLPSSRVPSMTADEAPLILTHICSPFRTLAQALPELWVSAHLLLAYFRPGTMDHATEETEPAIQAQEDEARLPFIRQWFERTGTRSLHLTISDEIIFANFDSCITDYALTLLDRVESLDLLVCRRTLPRFTESIPHAYGRLKRLRTVGDAFNPEDWAFLPYDAPPLTEFYTRSLRHPVPSLPLRFDRLTHLGVSYFPDRSFCPTATDVVGLLQSSPRLQTLRMAVKGVRGPATEGPEQELSLSHNIRSLKFYLFDSAAIVFTQVRMPSLRELHLVEKESTYFVPKKATASSFRAFTSAQMQQVRQVRKFEIEPGWDTTSHVEGCLKHLTGLWHLVLLKTQWFRGPTRIPRILGSLDPTAAEPTGGNCPHLDTLEIHTRSDPFDQFDLCLETLISLLHNKASASLRDPEKISRMRVVILPSQWRPQKGTPLATRLALCVEQAKVQLTFRDDGEEGTTLLKSGYWEESWYNA